MIMASIKMEWYIDEHVEALYGVRSRHIDNQRLINSKARFQVQVVVLKNPWLSCSCQSFQLKTWNGLAINPRDLS